MVPSSDEPHGAPFPSMRKCILVVEDELLIRLMVSEELRDAGYDVIEAFNADEALAVLNTRGHIDLIFSDVRMPGPLDGIDLLALVKKAHPSLPVIITSANLHPDVAITNGAARFLPKPYISEQVMSAVADELGRPE